MRHIRTSVVALGAVFVVAWASGLSGDLPSPVDQAVYYRGTPDECCTQEALRRSTQSDFAETIPADVGTGTTLLFAIGVHVEPHREYRDPARYDLDRARLLRLAEVVERHGGRLAIQVQRPFTETAQKRGDAILADLAARGHEIALHFHEDVQLPNANARPVADWIAALRREIVLIEALTGHPVTTWSGGNLYAQAFEAAAAAGLEVNINYKDPTTQGIPAPFMVLTPWRPGGSGSISERTTHDPDGEIVYVPSGVYPAHCPGAEGVPKPYTYRGFDYVTIALRNSLHAAVPGRVNTFIATVHPGDFLGPGDDEQEFAIWEEWLTRIVDPLVKGGRVRWATVVEMAEAYRTWEAGQGGAAPVTPMACSPVRAERVPGGMTGVMWIPSEAAPDGGIVVRITYPDRPRYPEGTAAVVDVPGGDGPGSVDLPPRPGSDPYAAQGLVHVQFAFPGGGRPPLSSGGTYDHRGLDSLAAVRDVVRFLRGEIRALGGCAVDELLPYPIAQVGLVGLSNGGNTAVAALGLFGEDMAVDWYVGWENPAGVQFTTVDLGARDGANPAYIPGSGRLTPDGAECDVDHARLRWDPRATARGHGPRGDLGLGVLYHDLNGDNRYDPSDYALGAYSGTFDGREKRVFSVHVLKAAVAHDLLDPWPADVATLDQAQAFWAIRDMSRFYDEVLVTLPALRVIVIGSAEDHVQRTPDYPHILLQYQGWQAAGIAWVRLNPDEAYIQALARGILGPTDNDANIAVDYANIARLVAREGVPDPVLQLAAVVELSDRSHTANWEANLVAPLVRW